MAPELLVPSSTQKIEAMGDFTRNLTARHEACPTGRKLNPQWKPANHTADLGNRGNIATAKR
jgi:hypothetical protein